MEDHQPGDEEWTPGSDAGSSSSSDDETLSTSASETSRKSESSVIVQPTATVPRVESDDNYDSDTNEKETVRDQTARRKYLRNSGLAYTSTSGKSVPARKPKPIHHCKRRQCHKLISENVAESIFFEYWEQGTYDQRVAYVCNRIEYNSVERHRRRELDFPRGSKSVSFKYYFDVGGERHNVCRDTFLAVLGESDRFLRICAAKKKASHTGVPPRERRGRRKPKHAMNDDSKKNVVDHIKSYPAYVSHYSRRQTKQKYLSNTLNLKFMWNQFNDMQDAAQKKRVSYSTYRRIFKTLNLKFKSPSSDTCGTCDSLKMKIKISKSEEEKKTLEDKHNLHLRRAQAAYDLKRQFKALAKEDEKVCCLIFDLEQVLPTPSVSTGVAYYLRQLNTYNLTIVDAATNVTHCYMWHEGEAARGANQIASALFHHIRNVVPDAVKELYLFSDCCSGQNRNSIVSAMLQTVLSLKPSINAINHIFLVPGHTRMECDTKHSLIERQKKKVAEISVPKDWYDLVRSTGSDNFKVTEMSDKMFNFDSLTSKDGPLIMRDKKEDGSKMYWTKTVWFRYEEPGLVQVKSSYNVSLQYEQLNMIRGTSKNRKLKKNWWNILPKLHPGNKISKEKKENLLSLLQYIDTKHHDFYRNLVVDINIEQETDPDLPSENEED